MSSLRARALRRQVPVVVLLLALGACVHRSAPADEPAEDPVLVHSDRAMINVVELSDQSLAGLDMLQVIERLRPSYLARRSGAGPTLVAVDNAPLASVSALRTLRVDAVMEVRLLQPSEAAQRYGALSNRGPVIVVRLK